MEAVVIMVVYMAVIIVVIRAFFVLERSVNQYCNAAQQSVTVEAYVKSMRRTQWIHRQMH